MGGGIPNCEYYWFRQQQAETGKWVTMTDIRHLTKEALEAGLDGVRRSPRDGGELQLIVRRPDVGEREVLEVGELSMEAGLVGDNWPSRPSSATEDRSPHPDRQLTLINTRLVDLVAQGKERWALAGDQLYVDLDLSADNLPPGTRLEMGAAIIEITAEAHRGCRKFAERFGLAALKFISAPDVQNRKLRGVYAKVIQTGEIRVGDTLTKAG